MFFTRTKPQSSFPVRHHGCQPWTPDRSTEEGYPQTPRPHWQRWLQWPWRSCYEPSFGLLNSTLFQCFSEKCWKDQEGQMKINSLITSMRFHQHQGVSLPFFSCLLALWKIFQSFWKSQKSNFGKIFWALIELQKVKLVFWLKVKRMLAKIRRDFNVYIYTRISWKIPVIKDI